MTVPEISSVAAAYLARFTGASRQHFLGPQLNFFVAIVMTAAGLAWFAVVQFRGRSTPRTAPPQPEPATRH